MRSNDLSLYTSRQGANGNTSIAVRPEPDQVNALLCWTSALSNLVLTTSTASLTQDVVDKFVVAYIPERSEKLAVRYSILVKQYALTREAFSFFEQMKKNTELLGSVFDPLPSTIKGNIQCISDPREAVVGNIVAASAEEYRIFIEKEELPEWGFTLPCQVEYVSAGQGNLNLYFKNDRYISVGADIDDFRNPPFVRGYYAVVGACLDCRQRNGNNVKPSFW